MAAEGIRWPSLYIISGHRSKEAQKEANPTQPVSYHRNCPALAVDLRVGNVFASITPFDVWKFYAELFELEGVLWGGDPDFPILDVNHFYLPKEEPVE